MPTSYTSLLGFALPVTGELNGTWGDVVNDNITSMIEEAIAGMASITTWTGASHTLTTADGTTDEARCAILDLGGSPGAAATVICPARTKLYIVHNNVGGGYAATLKTASGTGISIPSGKTMALYCDGTNVVEGVNYVALAANATTADKWTTARNLAGNSVDGSANVAFANKFIVQGTTDSGLSGAQFLGALGTGLVKNTTTTGVLSIASAGTDYAPATSGTSILKGNGSGGFSSASAGTDYAPATSGSSILYGNGTGGFSNVTIGTGVSFAGGTLSATGSGGTVTSVTGTSPVASSGGATPAISLSSGYGDTQNPYASKTANYFLAAPNGTAGVPTFRAMVAADVPTLNQNTTGTAAGLSTTLAVTSGGTGQTTYTNGQLLIGNTTGNTLTKATLTQGTGITITNGTGSITVANSLPMTYPGAGIAVSTGSAWGTSYTISGTGTVVAMASGATLIGVKETQVAVAASAIDLSTGNYFTKTITTTTTFTISNTATSGTSNSFILDITDGGSQTVNWWSNVKWAGGSAPILTISGRDSLGFYTYDAGSTWTGLVLGKDIK